jgi:hypothetical protein
VNLDESRAQAAVLGYEQHKIMRRGLLAADQRVHLTSKLSLHYRTQNSSTICVVVVVVLFFSLFLFSFFSFSELLEFHHM